MRGGAVNLVQTESVLHIINGLNRPEFNQTPEPGETVRGHRLVLDDEVWAEIGYPSTITVTIRPGDKLND